MSFKKCSISGCYNTEFTVPSKKFFYAPRDAGQRGLWIFLTGKDYSQRSNFVVCEDHFNVEDFDLTRTDGRLALKPGIIPHVALEGTGRSTAAVVVFILCWLPFFLVNIFYFVKGSQHKRPCTESVPFLIVMWMAFSSCCWNPIIYWMYNDTYRKGLTDLLNVCKNVWNRDIELEDRQEGNGKIANVTKY